MLLTVDVGNTNITLGLYEGDTLGPRWRIATDHTSMPDEYGLQFIGMDVVEVAPAYDVAEITALAAATVAWEYLVLSAPVSAVAEARR